VDSFFIISSSSFLLYLEISSSINHFEKRILIRKKATNPKINKLSFMAKIQIQIDIESSQEIIFSTLTIIIIRK
jgi:hypothetical protein